MSDWFLTSQLLQQEIIAAGQAQFQATRAAVDPAVSAEDAAQVARDAAEANVRVMQTFANFWGWM